VKKEDFLREEIQHVDIKSFNSILIIKKFEKMAFQARNIAKATKIYNKMLSNKDYTIFLCLAVAQDVTVAVDILGKKVNMHKYAIQTTVADKRDGGLSGSTLKETYSWGKVYEGFEQMVFSEATIAFPLIVSYAYHKNNWKKRSQKNFNFLLDKNKINHEKRNIKRQTPTK